jgi:hypothetical protein
MVVHTCVDCPACGGTGQTEFDTGSYPEWDLETCMTCDGTGRLGDCDACDEENDEW